MPRIKHTFILLATLTLQINLAWPTIAQPQPSLDEQPQSIYTQLRQSDDYQTASQQVLQRFDQVIIDTPINNPQPFRDAAFAVRLLNQLQQVRPAIQSQTLDILQQNPELASALVFLITPEDNVKVVYQLLYELHQQHGDLLNQYPNLTAAICVVHDKPIVHRINENKTTAEHPNAIFNYYRNNESQMMFGLKKIPAELLVYVVDNAVPIDQMQWALKRYAFKRNVGSLFFNIQYDHAHIREGKPKRVTEQGWSLPNILRYGGVCADQAYFAVAVGKSIGIPAVYTRGRSGGMGHAWVGYLRVSKTSAAWDFNDGRYGIYKGLKGIVQDSQTNQWIADNNVSLLAEMNDTTTADRHNATALFDAADKLLQSSGDSYDPKAEALIESGLRLSVGNARGWNLIAHMSQSSNFTIDKRRLWAGRVEKLCGKKYPDFALEIMFPLVQGIDDINAQSTLWQRAFKTFKKRPDLAAEICIEQARLWREAGNKDKAWQYYQDVVKRFPNDSPMVLVAIDEMQIMLIAADRQDQVPDMLKDAWKKMKQPGQMSPGFFMQSNWYQTGARYVKTLQNLGLDHEASRVINKIEVAGQFKFPERYP